MTNITLISKTNIIKQIFKLVSKKLSIDLIIIENTDELHPTDILVLDNQFNDGDIVKYKTICKKILLLSTDDNIDTNFDAQIKKPFLPSQLQTFLEKIKKDYNSEIQISNIPQKEEENIVDDLVSFVESIPDETIYEDDEPDEYCGILPDTEDTVVTKDDLGDGGVLDINELSKLHELINDEHSNDEEKEIKLNDEDLVDLSDLIDQAIDDINDYDFEVNKPIKLILNKYSMAELSPLFKKLNQNIIDNLVDGKEISLQLKLES